MKATYLSHKIVIGVRFAHRFLILKGKHASTKALHWRVTTDFMSNTKLEEYE